MVQIIHLFLITLMPTGVQGREGGPAALPPPLAFGNSCKFGQGLGFFWALLSIICLEVAILKSNMNFYKILYQLFWQ